MTRETIEKMRDLVEVQGSSGNWDYDEYMLGMYNGMELMLSIAEDREPAYKSKPKEWRESKEKDMDHLLLSLSDEEREILSDKFTQSE